MRLLLGAERVDQPDGNARLRLTRGLVVLDEIRLVREVGPELEPGDQARGDLVLAGERDLLDRLRGAGRERVVVDEDLVTRREGPVLVRLVPGAERHTVPVDACADDLVG